MTKITDASSSLYDEKTPMKDQHENIPEHPTLSQNELDLISEGEALAAQCKAYINKLMFAEGTDKRSIALAKTNLQQGFMWATRGIVKPTAF